MHETYMNPTSDKAEISLALSLKRSLLYSHARQIPIQWRPCTSRGFSLRAVPLRMLHRQSPTSWFAKRANTYRAPEEDGKNQHDGLCARNHSSRREVLIPGSLKEERARSCVTALCAGLFPLGLNNLSPSRLPIDTHSP